MKNLVCGMILAFALAMPSVSHSTLIISAFEVGENLFFSYSGSIDLTGLGLPNLDGTANSLTGMGAPYGALLFGHGQAMDSWRGDGYTFPIFGTGFSNSPTSESGDGFSIYSNDAFGIYDGYASNSFLSGSASYFGSFESFGLFFGSYTLTLPSDTVILNIRPAPVPATLALFAIGLAAAGWSRRKKA